MPMNMQVEIITLALILLIASHSLLIKKCFALAHQLPVHAETFEDRAGSIETGLTSVQSLLDEALDLISEFGNNVVPTNLTQTPSSIPEMILSRLLGGTNMAGLDGTTQEQNEWEIYPPDETQDSTLESIEHN